jgi:hypothetical protein
MVGMNERIAITARDMKRYELLQQVVDGQLTLAAAARVLAVSYRHAKRLKRKLVAAGPELGPGGGVGALVHGNRGRARQ